MQPEIRKLIESLDNDPHSWSFTNHRATKGNLSIWIANVPYADLTIGSHRLGTFFSRIKLRNAIKRAMVAQMLEVKS